MAGEVGEANEDGPHGQARGNFPLLAVDGDADAVGRHLLSLSSELVRLRAERDLGADHGFA